MTVTPTGAEAEALNHACGLHVEAGVTVDVPDKLITDAISDLERKTKWPGTRQYNHEAAYYMEMLQRLVARGVG